MIMSDVSTMVLRVRFASGVNGFNDYNVFIHDKVFSGYHNGYTSFYCYSVRLWQKTYRIYVTKVMDVTTEVNLMAPIPKKGEMAVITE